MPDLKLSKLPDRMLVKITITVVPDLNRALHAYAELYRETYGEAESVPELIPYMLQTFLESDRSYARAVKDRPIETGAMKVGAIRRDRRRRSDPPGSSVPKEV